MSKGKNRPEPPTAPPPHRGLRLVVVIGIHCTFVACILLLSACYTSSGKLTGFDQIALPGEEVELKAKLEYDGPGFINLDVTGVDLEFLKAENRGAEEPLTFPDPGLAPPRGIISLGSATSGDNGIARLTTKAPSRPGNHSYWVRLKETRKPFLEREASLFTVSVIPREQPILITDIDGTISQTEIGPVLADRPEEIPPLPGAPEVMQQAAESYRIIYLTARSTYLDHRTRNWLFTHRFPAGPIILRDLWWEWKRFNFKEEEFKTKACKYLKTEKGYREIRWGIGNKEGDALAYAENRINAIIVCEDPDQIEDALARHSQLVRPAASWEEIGKLILAK